MRPRIRRPRPTLSGGSPRAAPFPPIPSSSRLRPRPGLPRGSGDLGAPAPRDAVEAPHSGGPGTGPWAGARGRRQVSAQQRPNPAPLSTAASLPSFYGDGGPGSQRPEAGAPRGAARFCPFWRRSSGAARGCRWGRGESASARPPRPGPGPQRAQGAGGAAGGARGLGGFPARVSACVCSVRPPRASEVRVPGLESGGGGRAGGRGRGRGAAAAL